MSSRGRLLALLFSALPLVACGRQVGSVPFSGEGTKSTTVALAAGPIAFWTDLDLAYEGPATLGYRIELSRAGRTLAIANCDSLEQLELKVGWLSIARGRSHSSSGRAKMRCSASLPTAGPTQVKATLAFGVRPATAALRRADLLLKQ